MRNGELRSVKQDVGHGHRNPNVCDQIINNNEYPTKQQQHNTKKNNINMYAIIINK